MIMATLMLNQQQDKAYKYKSNINTLSQKVNVCSLQLNLLCTTIDWSVLQARHWSAGGQLRRSALLCQ